jgi:hypothetical protein
MIVDGPSLHDPGVHFQTISATRTGFGISLRRAKLSATDCRILIALGRFLDELAKEERRSR